MICQLISFSSVRIYRCDTNVLVLVHLSCVTKCVVVDYTFLPCDKCPFFLMVNMEVQGKKNINMETSNWVWVHLSTADSV